MGVRLVARAAGRGTISAPCAAGLRAPLVEAGQRASDFLAGLPSRRTATPAEP